MRPIPMEFVVDQDDQGSAMEVDDVEQLEICGESAISFENKLTDFDSSTTSRTISMTLTSTKREKKISEF
ncbi:beta-amylase 1 [Hibiscus syriacus]|uniref:Beta-amylase 1 n=1 Tax=Hibiscus syriacus TaxID=106335 RepID=A0A6A2ZZ33_HIBSY|nr:beta-amylase 1 [Hibiscus syriacus]